MRCSGGGVGHLSPVVGLSEGREHEVESVSDVDAVVNTLDERDTQHRSCHACNYIIVVLVDSKSRT